MAWFSGKIISIRWEDPLKSWYVLRMMLPPPDNEVAVVGTIHQDVEPGDFLGFTAHWVVNPKHGHQLEIEQAPALPPAENAEYITKCLAQEGISPKVLRALRKYAEKEGLKFGHLIRDPDRMSNIPGVGLISAQLIKDRWQSIVALHQTLVYLTQLGITSSQISAIRRVFGNDVEAVLAEDPWQLVRAIRIDFHTADVIAQKIGLDLTSPLRARAAVSYGVEAARGHGHLYTLGRDIVHEVAKLAPDLGSAETVTKTLKTQHNEGELVIDRKTRPGTLAIYEPWCWEVEEESARLLIERFHTSPDPEGLEVYAEGLSSTGPKTAKAYKSFCEGEATLREVATAAVLERQENPHNTVQLGDDQIQGAINALCEPVSIITGLPGTGKTFLLKTVVRLLLDAGVCPLLIAPTGMAAKRMEAATGAPAATIHRAFQAQKPPEEDTGREASYIGVLNTGGTVPDDISRIWGNGPHELHDARVVLLDEASMLDQHLLWRVLGATQATCRLVFVGDAAQLPSVGPGDVLRQTITSGVIPVVNLTKIFRQDEAGDIVRAAHDIHGGEVPTYDQQGEFTLLGVAQERDALQAIKKIVGRLWTRSQKGQDTPSFQVISPRHKGVVGVTNLNATLRELINPPQEGVNEVQVKDAVIREGDRITVVKNDYTRGVFNGDVGKVVRIDRNRKEISVKIHGSPPTYVIFPLSEVSRWLRLAYAVTVHRAQGQEFDMVVMPLVRSFHHQLQRNLLYTAVTRAKEKVVLIGHRKALARAVYSDGDEKRRTLFADRLKKYFDLYFAGDPSVLKMPGVVRPPVAGEF